MNIGLYLGAVICIATVATVVVAKPSTPKPSSAAAQMIVASRDAGYFCASSSDCNEGECHVSAAGSYCTSRSVGDSKPKSEQLQPSGLKHMTPRLVAVAGAFGSAP